MLVQESREYICLMLEDNGKSCPLLNMLREIKILNMIQKIPINLKKY
jgi:hypothetical protein